MRTGAAAAPPDGGAGTGALTDDALLGGRVRLAQPREGHRAAIDPVLLAAAVPAKDGERVLDVGAGGGAAALCLAARLPGIRVSGIEREPDLVRLATDNARANGLDDRVEFLDGDVTAPPAGLAAGSFDHVMANPPFAEAGRGNRPPGEAKARATVEGTAKLADWAAFCTAMARPRGSVTMIHRADRLDAVLAAFGGRLGGTVVFPLWPGPGGKAAKRVIVRGRKGSAAALRLLPGLVLHGPGGAYTREAEEVLRHARALQL